MNNEQFPDTIIEIYDDEQIYNVLAITEFKPKNVVYIGTRKLKSKRIKNNIINCFRTLGLSVKCFFYSTDMLSLPAIIHEIEHIISLFPGAVIDLTGGNEVALVAVGMIATRCEIPLFRYDRYECSYRSIYNCSAVEQLSSSPKFSVAAFLALAGGVMKEHGHLSLDRIDEETSADIFRIWDIYRRRFRSWHRIVSYLQQATKRDRSNDLLHLFSDKDTFTDDDIDADDSLTVTAPSVIYNGEKITNCDSVIMEELSAAGIIRNYANNNGVITFTYKSQLMRSCLIDTGICLELYVYATAIRSGEYDDAKLSVVVDWDGDVTQKINTINEIDVMLTRGQIPIFISCKSGSPSVTALNEIKCLAKQFGGSNARPILVTMADVRTKDAYLHQRAADMGVTVIDNQDIMSDKLAKRLSAAARL